VKKAPWYEDGDDAWFGPAKAKHNPRKNRIASSSKGHPAVKATKKHGKKVTRKRVQGK
jgi:hypothetical protein